MGQGKWTGILLNPNWSGFPHDLKGQGIYAYVIYERHSGDLQFSKQDIMQTVARIIGAIAKPHKIQFVKALPKTRSGKLCDGF